MKASSVSIDRWRSVVNESAVSCEQVGHFLNQAYLAIFTRGKNIQELGDKAERSTKLHEILYLMLFAHEEMWTNLGLPVLQENEFREFKRCMPTSQVAPSLLTTTLLPKIQEEVKKYDWKSLRSVSALPFTASSTGLPVFQAYHAKTEQIQTLVAERLSVFTDIEELCRKKAQLESELQQKKNRRDKIQAELTTLMSEQSKLILEVPK